METQFCSKWRPNGYPNLSEMGIFARTNGDPKSDFMKIYLNELNTWNTEEKNYGKTPSQIVAALTFSAFYSLKWRGWGPWKNGVLLGTHDLQKVSYGDLGPQMGGTHLGAVPVPARCQPIGKLFYKRLQGGPQKYNRKINPFIKSIHQSSIYLQTIYWFVIPLY